MGKRVLNGRTGSNKRAFGGRDDYYFRGSWPIPRSTGAAARRCVRQTRDELVSAQLPAVSCRRCSRFRGGRVGLKTARAQGDVWREYRRDDLGFRVEMPGEPKIKVEEDEDKDIRIRTVDAEVTYEQVLFDVHCNEYKQVMPAEEAFRLFREGMRFGGIPVTREAPLVMNGLPAREFVGEWTSSISSAERSSWEICRSPRVCLAIAVSTAIRRCAASCSRSRWCARAEAAALGRDRLVSRRASCPEREQPVGRADHQAVDGVLDEVDHRPVP